MICKNKTMKHVHFSEDETLLTSESTSLHCDKDALTEAECSSMFYSFDEMREFRAQVRVIRDDPSSLDELIDCWRGLEPYVSRRKEIRAVRRQHTHVVLERQSENKERLAKLQAQTTAGVCDQYRRGHTVDLMLVAAEDSRESINRAVVYAVRDFVETLPLQESSSDNPKQSPSFCEHLHSGSVTDKPRRASATARSA